MKLTNYNYGYYSQFDCSIHGKITMTQQEWKDTIKYLTSKRVIKSFLPSYSWTNTVLLEDIKKPITTKKGQIFNIRVPMTEKIVTKYSLPKYKRGNYMIEVLK